MVENLREVCDSISTHAPAGGATAIRRSAIGISSISTHAPAGGATVGRLSLDEAWRIFLLTPLREGRPATGRIKKGISANFYSRPCGRGDRSAAVWSGIKKYFYSRPCGRGDVMAAKPFAASALFLLTPLREGRHFGWHISNLKIYISTHAPAGGATCTRYIAFRREAISTHAPAGGATAIFHKSVMRFCGKLPKDDTVLCLASFGFPRRDPKAVYLA